MSITLVAVGNGGYNLASDIKNANLFTEAKLIVCDTDNQELANNAAQADASFRLDEIREAKLSILENAQALAEKLMQTKSEEVPEGTIPRLYHALFMVKEDWDAKPLQELAEDIASL